MELGCFWAKYMRNVFCPEYGRCLDQVIKENKTGFSCDRCGSRGVKTFKSDLIGEVLLLMAIFRPEIYDKFRELGGFDLI